MVPDDMPSSMIGCSSMPASLGIPDTGAAASPRLAGGASAAASVPACNAERSQHYRTKVLVRADLYRCLSVRTGVLLAAGLGRPRCCTGTFKYSLQPARHSATKPHRCKQYGLMHSFASEAALSSKPKKFQNAQAGVQSECNAKQPLWAPQESMQRKPKCCSKWYLNAYVRVGCLHSVQDASVVLDGKMARLAITNRGRLLAGDSRLTLGGWSVWSGSDMQRQYPQLTSKLGLSSS